MNADRRKRINDVTDKAAALLSKIEDLAWEVMELQDHRPEEPTISGALEQAWHNLQSAEGYTHDALQEFRKACE